MEMSPYLVVPLATVIINQVIVFARVSWKAKNPTYSALLDFKNAHAPALAFAAGLAATALAVVGVNSSLFPFGLLLGFIVYRQEQAKDRRPLDHAITIGVAVLSAFLLNYSYWRDSVTYFSEIPPDNEAQTYIWLFGALIALAVAVTAWTRRPQMRKLPTSRTIARMVRVTIVAPALAGLLVAFLQLETTNTVFTQRIYVYLALLWVAVGSAWAWWSVYRKAAAHLKQERSHFLKQQKSKRKKAKKSKKRSKR